MAAACATTVVLAIACLHASTAAATPRRYHVLELRYTERVVAAHPAHQKRRLRSHAVDLEGNLAIGYYDAHLSLVRPHLTAHLADWHPYATSVLLRMLL
jgi:hypothetical protein